MYSIRAYLSLFHESLDLHFRWSLFFGTEKERTIFLPLWIYGPNSPCLERSKCFWKVQSNQKKCVYQHWVRTVTYLQGKGEGEIRIKALPKTKKKKKPTDLSLKRNNLTASRSKNRSSFLVFLTLNLAEIFQNKGYKEEKKKPLKSYCFCYSLFRCIFCTEKQFINRNISLMFGTNNLSRKRLVFRRTVLKFWKHMYIFVFLPLKECIICIVVEKS